jgi:hypothetical protein
MRTCFAIVNTDIINRQNIRVPAAVLVSAWEQTHLAGTPMLISHDVHRPIGWTITAGMHVDPHRVALVSRMQFADSLAEEQLIGRMTQAYFCHQHSKITPECMQALRAALGNTISDKAEFIFREAACILDPGIVHRKFPGLSSQADKNGLIPLQSLKAIAPGVYEIEDGLCVFAHSYFRRSLSPYNNLNAPFLTRLGAAAAESSLEFKIALDPDAIALRHSYKTPIELAHWWGPSFNSDLTAIPAGVTRHEADTTLRTFHSILRTEFWWHHQSNRQNLECEEVLENPAPGVSLEAYGCRYVHSIIDLSTKRPEHLDGAIRMYDEPGIMERWDKSIADVGKIADYTKLWRVDGDLPIELWKALISDYFRDNTLVGEYLGASGDGAMVPKEVPRATNTSLGIPLLEAKDGLEAFVSMVSASSGPSVEIAPTAILVIDQTDDPYIEFSALDLIKLMRKRGLAVDMPKSVALVTYEDRDINFPRIIHRGPAAGQDVLRSLSCLVKLLTDTSNDDRNISVTLDVENVGGGLRYSLLGNAAAFRRLAAQSFEAFPASLSELGAWLERAKSVCGEVTGNAHSDLMHLNDSGIFHLQRSIVPPDMIVKSDTGELSIRCPKDDEALLYKLRSGNSRAALAAVVEEATCNVCHIAYRECQCCVMLDGGSVTINRCREMFFVWAERAA